MYAHLLSRWVSFYLMTNLSIAGAVEIIVEYFVLSQVQWIEP